MNDSDNFWRRKLILKVKFWHFLIPPHLPNPQNSMIYFDMLNLNSNFVPPRLKNPQTVLPYCLPKDLYLRQRANLPQLISLLFAQIKSTWLEVCKKKKKMINWLHGHFYRGFFSPKPQTLDFTTPENLKNHGWRG